MTVTRSDDVLVRRSAKGEITAYDRKERFLAHYIPGKGWSKGNPFPTYTLDEYFFVIQDDEEAFRILNEARNALGQSLLNDEPD